MNIEEREALEQRRSDGRKNKYRVCLTSLMRVYESNYLRLKMVLPKEINFHCVDDVEYDLYYTPAFRCRVKTLSVTKYTTMMQIWLTSDVADQVLLPEMTFRMYHDAKVAEVCAYQHCYRFQPKYAYPNKQMHQPDEKYQVNRLLADWLAHCLKNRVLFNA